MGLFSKLKGKDKQDFSYLQGSSSSPYSQAPPPEDYSHLSSENKGKGKGHGNEDYAQPPPGAPPGYSYDQPPPGPPPSDQYNYPPPTSLPPNFDAATGGSSGAPSYNAYPPPLGPPPGYMYFAEANRPEPPPPIRSQDHSQGLNASEDDAEVGHEYCRRYPVNPPTSFPPDTLERIHRGEVGLSQPFNFAGRLDQITKTSYTVQTYKSTPDTTLLSGLPLFSAIHDSPREKGYKTVYYEIRIRDLGKYDGESSIAIGFVNVPTPPFRLPGWHRGGLAIHSDDGNRYINDPYGGRSFTGPFGEGETIGLGIRFKMGMAQAFLVRDGSEVGNWMVDEPVDLADTKRLNGEQSVKGLMGDNDLYAAVGVFGKVEFEVEFGYSEWQDSSIEF